MILPVYVNDIIAALEREGHTAYAVGGCVRDSLLGLSPHDYDVTTSATPDEMREAFAGFKTVDTGIKHGTLTVISDDVPVEVTAFRIDGKYSDNRRPDTVSFTRNLREDLARRDFTINALAYSEKSGIVDYFGGREDLANRVIRAVGDPRERFREDGLRILRALRFAAVYKFAIEPNTAAAADELRGLIHNIAGERIAVELNKAVMGHFGCDKITSLTLLFDDMGYDEDTVRRLLRKLKYDRHTIKETAFRIRYRGLPLTPRELAVTGGDLYQAGLRGKAISDTLERLFQAVIDNDCINEKQALLKYLVKQAGFPCRAEGSSDSEDARSFKEQALLKYLGEAHQNGGK